MILGNDQKTVHTGSENSESQKKEWIDVKNSSAQNNLQVIVYLITFIVHPPFHYTKVLLPDNCQLQCSDIDIMI